MDTLLATLNVWMSSYEATLSGVLVETDNATGLATSITPVRDGGRLAPAP